MLQESIITEVTVTGVTVYGLALLFVKAWLILLLANTLNNQFEYGPAAIRHSIWLIALISLAALPLLTLVLPAWQLFSVAMLPVGSELSVDSAYHTSSPVALSLLDWSVIGYLVVAFGRLSYLSIQLLKVAFFTSIARNAQAQWYERAQLIYTRRVKIKVSALIDGPLTWGTVYPVILLPAACQRWSALERDIVLRHELGHIRRTDWLAQLLGQLVAVLYWPVPGVAGALRSLSLEAERACDDVVLAEGVHAADYAALLLSQARVTGIQATVALGKPSELAQRIRHIVNSYVDRAGERRARLCLATAACVFILPFAAIQAVGSIPQTGLLAGMMLVPVSLAIPEVPRPTVQPDRVAYDRPTRPRQVVGPPPAPALARLVSEKSSTGGQRLAVAPSMSMSGLTIAEIGLSRAKLRNRLQPEYPVAARRRGIEGRVSVEFDIDEHGTVINAVVTSATPPSIFNRAVLDALRSYQYEPYQWAGQAVTLKGLQEEFRFQLVEQRTAKRVSSGDARAGQKLAIDSS